MTFESTGPDFFFPDGDGGAGEDGESSYQLLRQVHDSYWPKGMMTTRRVYAVTSVSNGRMFTDTVGELTLDKRLVLSIFEYRDERGRLRYVIPTLTQTPIHIDPDKVARVRYFRD
jgi:hypothetical protein